MLIGFECLTKRYGDVVAVDESLPAVVSPFGKPVAARGGAAMQSQHLAVLDADPGLRGLTLSR